MDYRNGRYNRLQEMADSQGQAAAETLSLETPVQYLYKPVPPMSEWADIATDRDFLKRPANEQERLRYRQGETLEDYKSRNELYAGHPDFAWFFWQKYADRQEEVKAILGNGLTDDNFKDVALQLAAFVDSKDEGFEIRSLLNYNNLTNHYRFYEVYTQAFEQRMKDFRFTPQVTKVQGLEGYSVDAIKDIVREHVEDNFGELFMDDGFVIKDLTVVGSRSRGEAHDGSDLDILLEYAGCEVKEDAMFNILNSELLEIEGIKVDINPISPRYSMNTADWLARDAMWREEDYKKQHNIEKNMDINENLQRLLAEVMPHEGMRYDFSAGFMADDLDHRVTKDELLVRSLKNVDGGYLAGEDMEGYLFIHRLSANEQDFIYKLIREQQLAERIGDGRRMAMSGLTVAFDQNPDTGNFKQARLASLSVSGGELVFDGVITNGDHVGEEQLNFFTLSADGMERIYAAVTEMLTRNEQVVSDLADAYQDIFRKAAVLKQRIDDPSPLYDELNALGAPAVDGASVSLKDFADRAMQALNAGSAEHQKLEELTAGSYGHFVSEVQSLSADQVSTPCRYAARSSRHL